MPSRRSTASSPGAAWSSTGDDGPSTSCPAGGHVLVGAPPVRPGPGGWTDDHADRRPSALRCARLVGKTAGVVLRLLVVVVSVASLSACSERSLSVDDTEGVSTTSSSDLAAAGDLGTGVEITAVGRVTRVVDTYVFVLGEDRPGPVLVLAPGNRSSMRPGSTVEVTGTLRRLTVRAVEEEFGIDLDDRRLRDLEGQFAVVATRLATRE